MKRANHIDSSSIFRHAVLMALMEQAKTDPVPLRALLLDLLEKTPPSNIDKIGWLKGEFTLRAFYNSLIKHKSITCDFNLFRTHFEGTEQPQAKIVWQANLNELVYLFARLRDEKVIPLCKNPHLLLQENFLDKYEKPLNTGSLRTLLEKGISNDKRMEVIENIIEDVLSQKSL